MTPEQYVAKRFILPNLKIQKVLKASNKLLHIYCIKTTDYEVCRKCPTKSFSVHDRRKVSVRDSKLRNKHVRLIVYKRRFRCPSCKSVFTEAIDGVKVGFRTTEKYRDQLLYDFKNFESTKSVGVANRCSDTLVTNIVNERLELELRKTNNTPWGRTVCIDEHAFKRNHRRSRKEFVTGFVDNKRKCLRELAFGQMHDDLESAIKHIPGPENVTNAVIDMHTGYKNFILDFFPNAKITVDKFHVLRLIQPAIRKYRKEVTGDKRSNPIRKLLLKNRKKLLPHQKRAVSRFCSEFPNVGEAYWFKERLSNFYNIKGHKHASRILTKITDDMAVSKLPEIQKLRRTLIKWRHEILQYFKTGLTNARIEGFNRKCKLIQRKAYGFRSRPNYRLRVLYSCR